MGRPRRRRARGAAVLAATLVGGLATLGILAGASPASAHTQLTSSTPANGATVPTVPDHIELLFAQRLLGLGAVAVEGPGGASVAAGKAVLDGATVIQPLAANRPAGTYRLAYRVVSADGHPVSGEITFTATAATGQSAPAPSTAGASMAPALTPTATPAAAGDPTSAATALTNSGEDASGNGGWSTGLTVGVAVGAGVVAGGAVIAVLTRRRQGSRGQGSTDGT
ncbi:hypothetical protein BL253_30060 [Pseudofrankia asymbiotica]|uniref:CopC domain-containing protein n=1 Tax=Pseudofrankia asymbiotica TaxID=1834516 RepID=A0A1V2I384_9ACTN|nr:hypothetical protein BL253_30060 [Pseudofrankia asymbiotica]